MNKAKFIELGKEIAALKDRDESIELLNLLQDIYAMALVRFGMNELKHHADHNCGAEIVIRDFLQGEAMELDDKVQKNMALNAKVAKLKWEGKSPLGDLEEVILQKLRSMSDGEVEFMVLENEQRDPKAKPH